MSGSPFTFGGMLYSRNTQKILADSYVFLLCDYTYFELSSFRKNKNSQDSMLANTKNKIRFIHKFD